MANNGVSQHFKIENGLDLSSDSQFSTLGANTKIEYKNTGEKYIKNSNYSNVFDKTKSFATESYVSSAVGSAVGSAVEDINTRAIFKIDDANSSGVASCKNANDTQVDTFTCHVSKTANNPTLNWGSESVIGTVDGQQFKVKMPANPNTDTDTKYYSGTAITIDSNNQINHNNYMSDWGDYESISKVECTDGILQIFQKTFTVNKQGHITRIEDDILPVICTLKGIESGGESGYTSGTSGWLKIGSILVQWMKINAGTPTYYPYGTYSNPPLGFYSFCSQAYNTSADTSDYHGLLHVDTEKCYYNQDADNRYPNDISILLIGIAGSSSSGSSSSGSSSSGSSSSGSSSSGSETTEQGPVTKAWSYNNNSTIRSTKTDDQSEIISAVSALTGLNITRVESYTWTQMTSAAGQPYYLSSATYYYR